MNRQWLALFSFLLFMVVLLSASSTSAASETFSEPTDDSGLSKQQILHMGLPLFLEAYQHRIHHSWQVREAAYILYIRYKEQDNQRRLVHLPRRYRNQAKHLYATLGKWENDAFDLRYAEYSSGTAVRGIYFRRHAEFEEDMGHIIELYMSSMKINRISQQKRQQVNRWLTRLLHHFMDVEAQDSIQHHSEFRHSLIALKADTVVLQNVLSVTPQQIAVKLNEHLGRLVEDVE